MTNSQRSISGAVLILICTLCLTFILSDTTQVLGWVDLTSNNRYTLTDGTRSVLEKIRRPLKAELYYSKAAVNKLGTDQLKPYNRAYEFARDLLRAYERSSDGKVDFVEYDPEPYTDVEEMARELGLRGYDLPYDQVFYFGLAVTSDAGVKEVIPFISANEESVFEYRITKLIESASRPAKKKIGVLSALNLTGDNMSPEMRMIRMQQGMQGTDPWHVVDWLRRDYEVENIETTAKEIPAGIDLLLVVHPKDFGEDVLYAVDQFVMRGGKLIAMVDPFCGADQPESRQPYAAFSHVRKSDLNRLTGKWGVSLMDERIMGDPATSYIDRNMPRLDVQMFTNEDRCFHAGEVITQSLEASAKVLMLYVGALTLEGRDVTVEPLIQTTAGGGTRKFGNMVFMDAQRDPTVLWSTGEDGFQKAGKPVVAAVRMTGKFQSAFQGKPGGDTNGSADKDGAEAKDKEGDAKDGEAKDKDEPKKVEHLAQCAEPGTVILVADVDWISDQLVPNPQLPFSPYSNLTFLLNAIDFLQGSNELIGIRSRTGARREFGYIKAIENAAADRTKDKVAQINAEIEQHQKKLEELQSKATGKNVGLLRSQALDTERETKLAIARAKRELRDVKREALEQVESAKWWAQASNIAGMPLLVILIAVGLWVTRMTKRYQQIREDRA